MTLEEKEVERGAPTELCTDGTPLKVVVGTASNRASRPQERSIFTVEDALDLKRKRGFSHNDMEEVQIKQKWSLAKSSRFWAVEDNGCHPKKNVFFD